MELLSDDIIVVIVSILAASVAAEFSAEFDTFTTLAAIDLYPDITSYADAFTRDAMLLSSLGAFSLTCSRMRTLASPALRSLEVPVWRNLARWWAFAASACPYNQDIATLIDNALDASPSARDIHTINLPDDSSNLRLSTAETPLRVQFAVFLTRQVEPPLSALAFHGDMTQDGEYAGDGEALFSFLDALMSGIRDSNTLRSLMMMKSGAFIENIVDYEGEDDEDGAFVSTSRMRLLDIIGNGSLVYLDLSSSWSSEVYMSADARVALLNALRVNTTIQVLRLRMNSGSTQSRELYDLIANNTTLKRISIDDCNSDDVAANLAAAFARNTTLEAIEIHPCDIEDYVNVFTDNRIRYDPLDRVLSGGAELAHR